MRLWKPLRAIPIACIALAAALALPAATHAFHPHPGALDCRSGRTLFRRPGTRAFVVVRQFRFAGGSSPYETFYACRPGSRTPRIIFEGAPFTRDTLYGFRGFGDRLGFLSHSEGVQSGSETEVGWIDLRIGRVRTGRINASEGLMSEAEEEPGLPRVPDGHVAYAIAGDGTVAVIGHGGYPLEWEVCVLPVKLHSLGPPRPLYEATAGQEGVDPRSLTIGETTVAWRTEKGQPVSAAR